MVNGFFKDLNRAYTFKNPLTINNFLLTIDH
jgi:hypothetical protein